MGTLKNNRGFDLLNEYYDKIYVVTIPRSFKEREIKIRQNLNGLNYTIFWGVDGTKLNNTDIIDLYDSENARKNLSNFLLKAYGLVIDRDLSLSELGCSLSHLNVYIDVVSNGYERVLILEDDAKVMLSLEKHIPQVLSEIPVDCDFLYWGYRKYDSESKIRRIFRLNIWSTAYKLTKIFTKIIDDPKNENYPVKVSKFISRSGLHVGSHAYAINLRTAQKLISANKPVSFCADQLFQFLYSRNLLNCYVTSIPFIREDQTFSSSITEIK